MTMQKQEEPQKQLPDTPPTNEKQDEKAREEPLSDVSRIAARLEELDLLPHRHQLLHWGAFILSVLSLVLLSIWVIGPHTEVPISWIIIDIVLGGVFAIELFTRSGFRWGRAAYLRSRFFDFIAIVPALALVNHGFFGEGVWVWLILVTRFIRAVDRILGDGFVKHLVFAIIEAFEEEITDRVLDRIITRLQADLNQMNFSHGVAQAFARNKADVLQRVRAATPKEGLVPTLAQIVGLVDALERAEERTFDAIVEILDSQEVDRTVRDIINTSFSRLRGEIGRRSWHKHFQLRHGGLIRVK